MKVAFIDRDGVINKEIGYLHSIDKFEYTDNAVRGLRILIDQGYHLVIVTNQAGIAKGYYSEIDYDNLMNWMVADLSSSGVDFLDILFCPHHPEGVIEKYAVTCSWRKPMPGMFLWVRDRYGVSMSESIVIGDKLSDVEAGLAAGVGEAFLVGSGHPSNHDDQGRYYTFAKDLFSVACIMTQRS